MGLTKERKAAEENMQKLELKWDKLYGKVTQVKRRPAEFPVLCPPPGRETKVYKSMVTPGGDATKKAANQYSGSSMLGVGTMHKSNMVPIFNTEEAKAISSMRR